MLLLKHDVMLAALIITISQGDDFVAEHLKQNSSLLSLDYSKGFGGKYGVDKDKVDKSAVGFEYQGKTEKHESQKGFFFVIFSKNSSSDPIRPGKNTLSVGFFWVGVFNFFFFVVHVRLPRVCADFGSP